MGGTGCSEKKLRRKKELSKLRPNRAALTTRGSQYAGQPEWWGVKKERGSLSTD